MKARIMKLAFLRYQLVLAWDKSPLLSLAAEDPRILERLVLNLINVFEKKEEQVVLTENEELLDLRRRGALILSPFDLRYDRRTMRKKLLAALAGDIANEDLLAEIASSYGAILAALEQLELRSDYRLAFTEDIFIGDILAACGVEAAEPQGTFPERLREYAETRRRLEGKDIFFLLNCGDYLSKEDLSDIMKWSSYQEIRLVFIGGRRLPVCEGIKEYILDADFCEIF